MSDEDMSDGDATPMNNIQEANYIKLDGQVFSITPIANSEMNIEAELKQFYNEKYQAHIVNFNGGIVAGMTEDWNAQIQKLRDHNRSNTVTVPRALMSKYIICHNGSEVEEVRSMIYSPNIFKMVRSDIAAHLRIAHSNDSDEDEHGNIISTRHYDSTISIAGGTTYDLNDYSDDEVLLVTVKQKIMHVALYSYNSRNDRLYCNNLNTFHNQGSGICTGSHRASEFWNNPEFEKLMNQVNCFSLGSQSVHYRERANAPSYGISEYVKRSTIISIEPERAGQWRT
jgi:hypothetical protein